MQVHMLARQLVLALTTAGAMCLNTVHAQEAAIGKNYIDGIAAVVNQEVITLRTLQTEAQAVEATLKAQNIPVPSSDVLQQQVLQRLIDERLLNQEALEMGIDVKRIDVNLTAEEIAQRNNLSLAQLRQEVEKSGLVWNDYLEGLRQEVLMEEIRHRVIDPRISISESEIDAFLKSQGITPSTVKAIPQNNEVIELAQILVRVPEGADRATQDELKRKAEGLLQQVRQGGDFAGLAASSSDGPEALQGGSMGARPLVGWPEVFGAAVKNTPRGQVTELVRSGAGYHIIKVLNRGEAPVAANESDLMVTQTRARHILVKFSPIMTDEKARQRIEQLAARIKSGENFEEVAKAYSEDAGAPQGGDLGWLNPGETVPAFEQAMDALAEGQVSEPVRSQFGWHIIRVDDRRQRNVGNEFQRMQARQALHQQRTEPAFDDWFSQIRSQAFIDNRLNPESGSGRRN